LYIKCKESHLAILSISTLRISRVRPFINLAALQRSDSRARNPSLLVKLPHIGNAYYTEGKIVFKYKSGSILRGKKELRFSKFNLLTKLFSTSKICWDHVSLLWMGAIHSTKISGWKFRSKTQWIGSVQPEKFRKNSSTFWGGPLFPDLGWMDGAQLLPRDQAVKPHVTSDLWDQFVYSTAILVLLFWHPNYSRHGKKKSHQGCWCRWCVFNLNARLLETRISHIRDCSLVNKLEDRPTEILMRGEVGRSCDDHKGWRMVPRKTWVSENFGRISKSRKRFW